MKRMHFIAMDTHGKTTDACCKTSVKSKPRRWHVPTTIPELRAVIESVPQPRCLTFEEGPLADWLHRELHESVDELIVSEPRRNAHVAKDGDKDDPIDAEKLCNLYMGGYLKAVHHSGVLERSVFKRRVSLYHDRVEHRVAEANKIIGFLKGWGIVISEGDFSTKEKRAELCQRIGEGPVMKVVREQVELLWRGHDQAVAQEEQLERELEKAAKKNELIVRLTALPGVKWIRASTFVAYVDTPWRFAGKKALWKYLGIGLVRERSGEGKEHLHVEMSCNRRLKSVALGAAARAIELGDNPFAAQYACWVASGVSPRNAKRNVARSLWSVAWGMWKNGGVYDPDRVGVAALPTKA